MSRDTGTVTAELAVALPGVVLLCAALLMTGQAVIGEVRCTDAARAGARLAARGEPPAAVAAEATRRAPPGASVGCPARPGEVSVVGPGAVGWPRRRTGPAWSLSGSATASVEDSP